jgi:hypothetical protein
MKPLLKCQLVYNKTAHLEQLYAGFVRLEKLGIIDLRVDNPAPGTQTWKGILFGTVNDQHKLIYDTLDGLNWIPGTIEENLHYFKRTFTADYYFKRSYTRQLKDVAPAGCKILPLGFNYRIRPPYSLTKSSMRDHFQQVVRRSYFASRMLRMNNDEMSLPSEDYEQQPILNKDVKILFLTRIWNPDEFKDYPIKPSVETLNKSRIAAITTCRKEFGKIFCGGLTDDDFSRAHAKSLIAPLALTNKKQYLELVKEHAVCIATTGLHGSIGWKFAEYVAASRAIVSEPLLYEVPGGFKKDQNYLEFRDERELPARINALLDSRVAVMKMMQENYRYYNNYLKPENLVLNTLLQVLEEN